MKFIFKSVCILSILIFTVHGKASSKPENPRSKTQDILAIPVGGFAGFGIGHILQERYSSGSFTYGGWIYTVIDGTSAAYAVATTFGDCRPGDTHCKDRQDNNRKIALALFVGSRIAQIIDLTYFVSQQNYTENRPTQNLYFAVVPDVTGVQTTLGWSF
jgi:hypothetical protein